MHQHTRNGHLSNVEVVVKTDRDYDIQEDDDVVIVLADACNDDDDDDEDAEPVELTLPRHPHDGMSVRLIAAGQAFTLDGGNFVVGNGCDDDDEDDEDPADRVFPVGTAIDVVFADLAFDNCTSCGHCGCKKRSKCDCPRGRWFIVGQIPDQAGDLLAGGLLGLNGANQLTVTGGTGILAFAVSTEPGGQRCYRLTLSTNALPTLFASAQAEGIAPFTPLIRIVSSDATTTVVDVCLLGAGGLIIDPLAAFGAGGTGGVFLSAVVSAGQTFAA